jgi:hypothetical protein
MKRVPPRRVADRAAELHTPVARPNWGALWGPFARLRLWPARRAVRRGDHVAALSGAGARSAPILCGLGMYRAAAEADRDAADPDSRRALALALAHLGCTQEAAMVAAGCRLSAAERVRLALGIARWDGPLALEMMPLFAHAERAAIALRQGELSRAVEELGRAGPKPSADRDALWAAIAACRGDAQGYRQRMNGLLAGFGLFPCFGNEFLPDRRLPPAAPPSDDRNGVLVSVVMAARNCQDTIAAAIASVLNQSLGSLELIVVDDASTDATAKLADDAARDPRVRVITLARQGGAYVARNAGVRAARGRFLTFADADDFAHPQRLARAVQAFEQRPGSVAHVSRLVRLDARGAPVSPRVFPLLRANASSLTVRRDTVIGRLGYFEEVWAGADSEYIGRVVAAFGAGSVMRSPEPLVFAGASRSSLTSAPETGVTTLAGNQQRIAYWEEWHWRHVRQLREGVSLYKAAATS